MSESSSAHNAERIAEHGAHAARGVEIREATIDDADAIAEIAERIFVHTFSAQNTPSDLAMYIASAFGPAHQRRELADPANVYLLASARDHLAAFALLRVGATDPAVSGDAPVEIQRFYVDEHFHGQGLAPQLMDACVAKAQSRGGRTLWLGVWEHNPRAIRFYEKRGFRDVGSHAFLLGTDRQTDRVMQCDIGPVSSSASSVRA